MADRIPQLPLDAFPARSTVPFRYGDTDRQGHVNNAVFATLCETGRVELIAPDLDALEEAETQFVIARLVIDFLGEMHWPGEAIIGTGVTRIGRSSVALRQGIFFKGRCCAMADSVIVLMHPVTRRAAPLPDELRQKYAALAIAPEPAGG